MVRLLFQLNRLLRVGYFSSTVIADFGHIHNHIMELTPSVPLVTISTNDGQTVHPDHHKYYTTDTKLTFKLFIPRFSEICFAKSLILLMLPLTMIVSRQLSFARWR